MPWSQLLVLFVGLLAAVGLVGVLGAAVVADRALRVRMLRMGAMALTLAGGMELAGNFAGVAGRDSLAIGMMLLVFGTGVGASPAGKGKPQD